MKYAWNITNVSDLRAKPGHGSERVSQLLFSEIVEIIRRQGSFVKVRQLDGYEGWVYSSYMKELLRKDTNNFLKLPKSVLTTKTTQIFDKKDNKLSPYIFFYGTVVTRKSKSKNKTIIRLPDSSLIYIKGNKLRPIEDKNRYKVTGTLFVREAEKFLGIPYLWGGITPLGYDCSGLVQMVYRSFGIILPRDTKDQIKMGKPVTGNSIKTGDLLFFKRHVGLAIGETKLIHTSRNSGGVRIESLVKHEENYREDLVKTFVEARRII
jgi:gamma-D-glutamyl-L-lysine dipeptidyl-peptidase